MTRLFKFISILFVFTSCSKEEITPTIPQTSKNVTLESILILNPPDTLIISKEYKFNVVGTYSNKSTKDLSDSVIVTTTSTNVTLKGNAIYGAKSGNSQFTISYKDKIISKSAYIHNIEYVTIPDELKTKGKGKLRVPVVVISYLPTLDGIKLDTDRAPDGWGNIVGSTLTQAKNKFKFDIVTAKNSIEEGTRFRDYGSNTNSQYVDIDIVLYVNVYEMDLAPFVRGINTIDYKKLFTKLNLEKYVDVDGVREVWIAMFPKELDYPVVKTGQISNKFPINIPESNMSSPLTGDISNSERIQNDLPIYKNTYVVYGFNGHRGVETGLHCRGHQLESQLTHIDKFEFLWQTGFTPKDSAGTVVNRPRLGNTHYPPNGKQGYDYANSTPAMSDIKTWKPSGGTFVSTNKDTWGNIKYSFLTVGPNVGNFTNNYDTNIEVKWLIFWWQSIPGFNNNIPYGNKTLTNWWDVLYKWDETIKTGRKLYN